MDKKQKLIRFIDSRYHNLFTVPDGGNVVITCCDGERLVRPCRYVDETHVEVGNYLYHICEFAEKMEAAGNTYEPENPEKVANYAIVQRVDFDDHKGIALGYNPSAPEPFVTWMVSEHSGERRFDFGRYRKILTTAQKDFCQRRDEHIGDGLYPCAKVVYQFDHTDRLPKTPTKAKGKPSEPER